MQFRAIALAALLAAALLGVRTPAGAVSTEEAVESSTSGVVLPRTVGGTLLVSQCRSCPQLTLTLDAQSRYFIGKSQVTLAELTRFLDGGGLHGLTIFYKRDQRTINRVVVGVRSSQRLPGSRP